MIDLRTDAMTPPTEAMWAAMRSAELGWAMRDEDRNVLELQALGAALTGKETALFTPTCSMANLLALLTLGERGTQVILESGCHTVTSEEWGVAALAGLFPRLLSAAAGAGAPTPAAVEAAFAAAADLGLPGISLVCLENSHNNAGGIAVTAAQTAAIAEIAHRAGACVHLDGARLFNAAAALGASARDLAEPADTVVISLNKGLCAPLGALLCGRRAVIESARGHARRFGAANIHKAGIFAAAGLVALNQMVGRLADDNRRARILAERLAGIPGLRLDLAGVQTNLIFADVTAPGLTSGAVARRLAERGILALARPGNRIRFVTHRLIGDAEVATAALETARVMSETAGSRS
jgi:threonine aldolase